MVKRIIAIIISILIIIFATIGFTGCREADKVNHNMSLAADNFSCERRITVYNARTDKIVMYAEGYMSISNNATDELVVTCKVGPNEYKKNYIYLNDYTLYVVEDITGTHADPYHYVVEFHTEFPVDVDVKP